MAMCLGKLGDFGNDRTLSHESLKLYHRGLHELQRALSDPNQMYDDQTLASSIALASYELSQCPTDSMDAYLSHTSGCAKLIQLRGPEAHTQGLGHQVFVHYRAQGVSMFGTRTWL
jgi:hypothetical protein